MSIITVLLYKGEFTARIILPVFNSLSDHHARVRLCASTTARADILTMPCAVEAFVRM